MKSHLGSVAAVLTLTIIVSSVTPLATGQQPGSRSGRPQLQFKIKDTNAEGRTNLKEYAASSVDVFSYRIGSLKPQLDKPAQSMGMGYGGEAGYGAGGGYADDSYAGGYGGSGEPGPGMGGFGPGGTEGMGPSRARAANLSAPRIKIRAYTMPSETKKGDAKLILAIKQPSGTIGGLGGGGYGGDDSYGGGSYGGGGYGGESIHEEILIEWSALMDVKQLVPGQDRPANLMKYQIDQEEFQIVSDTIFQTLAKGRLVQQIQALASVAGDQSQSKLETLEAELREVLTAEYQTQLARQKREVNSIEQRVSRLRKELERRQAAMQRVVDVQLGNIVLEAQGLLQTP